MRTITGAVLIALLPCAVGARPASGGEIAGRIHAPAEEVARQPPRYLVGPRRAGRQSEDVVRRGPQDVVIWVEGLVTTPPEAATPAVMAQEGEEYVPHVLPVQAGTLVSFPNRDDYYHNVFSVVAGDRFDLGRFASGESADQRFTKPGVVVVRCEIHSRMKAYILVVDSSVFDRASEDGGYRLAGVPAGRWTVKAWHPTKGEQQRIVEVPREGRIELDFTF